MPVNHKNMEEGMECKVEVTQAAVDNVDEKVDSNHVND